MQAVDHVLRTTRSVRRRLDFERPVEPEILEDCIRTAVQAPTGVGGEAWRFLVIRDPEKKGAIADLYRSSLAEYSRVRRALDPEAPAKQTVVDLADRLHELPVLILVCAVGRPGAEVPMQVAFYGSILPAAWSLMVALRARGLGSTWTTLLCRHEREVAAILGIPDDVTQTVLLPVAYMSGAKLKPAQRLDPEHVTYWDAWGERR